MDWVKTTAKCDEKHLSFGICCVLYQRFDRMCHKARPPLVWMTAQGLFATKPLSGPVLAYCWLDTWQQTSLTFESKYKIFIQEYEFENAVQNMEAISSRPQCWIQGPSRCFAKLTTAGRILWRLQIVSNTQCSLRASQVDSYNSP